MLKSVVLCALLVFTVYGQKCLVPFGSKTHWDVFWPLVFQENGSLYPTEIVNDEEVAVIPAGSSAYVSCGPNYIKHLSRLEKVSITCTNGKLTNSDLNQKDAKDLACDLRAIEEVLVPVPGCPEEKTSVRFGFVHPVDNSAHITGEACYCTTEGRTLFAHVRLGTEEFASLEVVDKNFFKQAHPESRYKVDFMKAFRLDEFNSRLKTALKIPDVPPFKMTNYVDKHLLWNGQLVATRKLAWNYFILHHDLQNFKGLRADIGGLEQNVDIYIGSHGVTTAMDAAGKRVPIYLDGERFPVPELIWIVVKNGSKATAFAVFNDPTLTATEITNKSYCNSKCETISWLQKTKYLNPSKGAVLCCEYEELKKNIKEIPALSGISGLLV